MEDQRNPLRLMWIHSESMNALDAATWLSPTRIMRQWGWHVTLIAEGPDGFQTYRGVQVLCVAKPHVYLLRQAIYHLKIIRRLLAEWEETDIVMFSEMTAIWMLPLRIWRDICGRTTPLFVMDTRTLPMEPREKAGLKDKIRGYFLLLMNRIANRWLDGRLAITGRMAEVLHIPAGKLWGVWPSGVELDSFNSIAATRRWPDAGDPINLIYIGAMHYERNLMKMSQAVVKANASGMSFVLWLVGDGNERLDLEKYAATSGGAIKVVGSVSPELVPEYLVNSHVGVLPFPDEEKFQVSSPIKLFEYMASGMPVLVTRVVCHSDVIGNGDFAFWAESSDVPSLLNCLREIWSSAQRFSEMGLSAQMAVKQWTWTESARKLGDALAGGLQRAKWS